MRRTTIMDELQLLADCLPEQQPPGLDVTEAARRRLPNSRPSRRVPFAGVRPARRELLLRAGLPTAGVAVAGMAAAAALVVAVAATAPAGAHTGVGYASYTGAVPAANSGSTIDGREVLLMAATQVAKKATPPVTGRYWVTSGTAGNFLQVGPAADPYTVLDESQVQYWAARSPKDGSPSTDQQLGAAPVSAADRAAWQRDGSPTTWNYVYQRDGLAEPSGRVDGFLRALRTVGGPLAHGSVGYGAQQFWVGDQQMTLAQLQALPADPAQLEKLILAGVDLTANGGTPGAYLLGVVPSIMEMPVTSAVRATLYQMLAAVPGVQSLGEVTDPVGQQGEAVANTATYNNCGGSTPRTPEFSSCTTQEILIINQATGLPLAEELRYVALPGGQQWPAPDQLFSYEIFGQSHWTDASPPPSAQIDELGPPLKGYPNVTPSLAPSPSGTA
jgi:hypothetical protein